MTANSRDKQRSFEAAESAIEYGVWWLQQPGGGTSGSCAGNNNATVAALKVCTEPLSASLTTIADVEASGSWAVRSFAYTPPNMTVNPTNGGMANATDVNYYQAPGLYVENLGLSTDGKSQFYQMTAFGYGGDSKTVSVVRGTFKQTSASKNRGTP
jgi:type IV pilus assembly protein PilX